MKTALIIIDMQQGLFATPRHDANGIVKRINDLAERVRQGGGIIVFIQHDGQGEWLQPGSAGWQLLADLRPVAGDHFIRKASCDCFLETELQALLEREGIRRLVITGCATDYCVDTTVRSALARRYSTIVPSDGHTCSDRPHLPAVKVIEHHNAIWADFIAPAGPALICPCAEIKLA
jgi:nicotinamidase-related amidase